MDNFNLKNCCKATPILIDKIGNLPDNQKKYLSNYFQDYHQTLSSINRTSEKSIKKYLIDLVENDFIDRITMRRVRSKSYLFSDKVLTYVFNYLKAYKNHILNL